MDNSEKVPNSPDPVDVHVGSRLRLRRTVLGISQSELGNHLGLTFQQIQKYELGKNRIASGRLYRLSQILRVPISFFFDDMEEIIDGVDTQDETAIEGQNPTYTVDRSRFDVGHEETRKLVRAYYGISDKKLRQGLLKLMNLMAGTRDSGTQKPPQPLARAE